MAGEVLGSGFKFVIQSLLGAELLFPELRTRIAGMRDEAWYSWADYVQAAHQVAAILDDATVVAIGQQVMLAAQPLLAAQGFGSPEALLGDWQQVFLANVRGLDQAQLPTTEQAQPGMAVVDYALELPAPLIEGFLRGAVLMYGRRVEGYQAVRHEQAGAARLRCAITWR